MPDTNDQTLVVFDREQITGRPAEKTGILGANGNSSVDIYSPIISAFQSSYAQLEEVALTDRHAVREMQGEFQRILHENLDKYGIPYPFISDLWHEVSSSFTAIDITLQVAHRKKGVTDEYIERIQGNLGKIKSFVDHLPLRIGERDRASEIVGLVEEIVNHSSGPLTKKIELLITRSEDADFCKVESAMTTKSLALGISLIELIANAGKSCDHVRKNRNPLHETMIQVHLGYLLDDQRGPLMQVMVRDNGRGIYTHDGKIVAGYADQSIPSSGTGLKRIAASFGNVRFRNIKHENLVAGAEIEFTVPISGHYQEC